MIDSLTLNQAASAADYGILGAIVLMAAVCIFGIYTNELRVKPHMNNVKAVTATAIIICGLSLSTGLYVLNIAETASAHGMPPDDAAKYTISEINKHISQSPTEDNLPDNLDGAIIIYYKFACEDCENLYNDLITAANQSDKCYFVATGSETGQALLAEYPVTEVPSGVYIQDSQNAPYIAYALYKKQNDNDTATFQNEAWARLLSLQTENQTDGGC